MRCCADAAIAIRCGLVSEHTPGRLEDADGRWADGWAAAAVRVKVMGLATYSLTEIKDWMP